MRKKRIFFSLGILFVLAIGIWVFYRYNKPHERVVSGDVAASIHADSLYNFYSGNESEANEKFLNKVIEVKGTISEISKDEKNCMILLETKDAMGGINCQLSLDAIKNSSLLHKGDEIVVMGRCTGFNIDVNLTDCAIQ